MEKEIVETFVEMVADLKLRLRNAEFELNSEKRMREKADTRVQVLEAKLEALNHEV
jgi:hypothetical protein